MSYRNKWIPKRAVELLQAENGRILDVGGGAAPYYRATHIADIQPYDAERLAGNAWGRDRETEDGGQRIEDSGRRDEGGDLKPEGHKELSEKIELTNSEQLNNLQLDNEQLYGRWSNSDYTQIDLCECERLPFADDSFDLGLCSHVLEDLRDPVRVVNEVFRVCRRVMVIAPSRFIEQMKGVDHPEYAGFYHHMWMLYERDGEIIFRRKTPTINLAGCHLSCPLFKTVTVEAGSFMYLGSKGHAREEMFWSEKEDAEDLKKFVAESKGRSGCFEFDPKWKRPAYVAWKLRQALFGAE